MIIPSRNFDGHSYVIEPLKRNLEGKMLRGRLRRTDSTNRLLRRVRCSKKVQVAAKRAGLPNPKWQLA